MQERLRQDNKEVAIELARQETKIRDLKGLLGDATSEVRACVLCGKAIEVVTTDSCSRGQNSMLTRQLESTERRLEELQKALNEETILKQAALEQARQCDEVADTNSALRV